MALESKKVPSFVSGLFGKLVGCLKEANKLPTEEDFMFFESHPEFITGVRQSREKAERLLGALTHSMGVTTTDFSEIKDLAELCLERVDIGLDKLSGALPTIVESAPLTYVDIPKP
jgi:hypothetical protein